MCPRISQKYRPSNCGLQPSVIHEGRFFLGKSKSVRHRGEPWGHPDTFIFYKLKKQVSFSRVRIKGYSRAASSWENALFLTLCFSLESSLGCMVADGQQSNKYCCLWQISNNKRTKFSNHNYLQSCALMPKFVREPSKLEVHFFLMYQSRLEDLVGWFRRPQQVSFCGPKAAFPPGHSPVCRRGVHNQTSYWKDLQMALSFCSYPIDQNLVACWSWATRKAEKRGLYLNNYTHR